MARASFFGGSGSLQRAVLVAAAYGFAMGIYLAAALGWIGGSFPSWVLWFFVGFFARGLLGALEDVGHALSRSLERVEVNEWGEPK